MNPIFIIGYMGAGKSTFGRKLASALGLNFIDTDIFIENRFRERIADMFIRIGEEAFRKRERFVIEELSGMTDTVIATGGGMPCYYSNIELMNASGLTIYLEGSTATLAQRLEYCKRTRPTVCHKSGQELHQHVEEAMQVRTAYYSQAQITISIEEIKSDDDEKRLAHKLAQQIRELYHG